MSGRRMQNLWVRKFGVAAGYIFTHKRDGGEEPSSRLRFPTFACGLEYGSKIEPDPVFPIEPNDPLAATHSPTTVV